MRIPCIKVIDTAQGAEAISAIRVASLLHSELLVDGYYRTAEHGQYSAANSIDPLQLHHTREDFISALAGWTDSTLEIRLAVVPDLASRTQSLIRLHLLIRCPATDRETAREKVAERHLALQPLLAAQLPEAVCETVTDNEEMDQVFGWLKPKYAISVQRRCEKVSLANPLDLPSPAIGFHTTTPQAQGDAIPYQQIQHLFPWIPELDDWSRLLDTLTCQMDPLLIILRLKPLAEVKADRDQLHAAICQCEDYLLEKNSDRTTGVALVQRLRDLSISRLVALSGPSFAVGVFMCSANPVEPAFAHTLGPAITHLPQGNNPKHFFKGGYQLAEVDPQQALAAHFFADTSAFGLSEAACAFRLPSPPCREIPGLEIKRFRTALAQIPPVATDSPSAIRLFVNEHMGVRQPVDIDSDARMRHLFIVGQTGTGKSSFMESMIVQDIHAGRGVAVIDPHGDMVDNILERIPRKNGNGVICNRDVILFDFLDSEFPLGFNMFEWRTLMERDLIIDELYRTFDHIYDLKSSGGPIFEQYYRNMARLLMGSEPRPNFTPTLLDFQRAFIDKDFRHWLRDTAKDLQAADFLKEAERTCGEASWANVSVYITSKLTRFVSDTLLSRIVGQEKSALNFDEIINSGKILLVKLGKGRFGSQISALLANMLVLRFKLAAMKRGEIPPEDRRDFFLYVDEAHNLPQENFAEMLSEVRKYRMGMVLATQYCSQIGNLHAKGGNDLLSAVFGNVGTTLTFRTGSQDAELLAKGLKPHFNERDITSLPNFHGYARMNLSHKVTPPFSFRTELCPMPADSKMGQVIRNISRKKYGTPAHEVEGLIAARRDQWKTAEDNI